MVNLIEVFLEIVKVTVPALIVFATVYFLFKKYTENLLRQQAIATKQDNKGIAFPLRMQAYERLVLFCERISLHNLMLRVRNENMSAADLKIALMVSIQQEYEHNISQQVYVSENLWKIINFAKNDTINVINLVSRTIETNASSLEMSHAIFKYLNEAKQTSLDTARSAISQEASTYL
ncbi:MAG: hypothetical protein ACI94Y_000507 [Maribacter sp.]|jgi:hypothetical protein